MSQFILLTALGLIATTDPVSDASKADVAALQGKWDVTAHFESGKAMSGGWFAIANTSLEFKETSFVYTSFGRSELYSIKLDCSKKPRVFVARLVSVNGKPTLDADPDMWAYEIGKDSIKVGFKLDGKSFDRALDPQSRVQVVFVAKRKAKE
jgi:uncharacterized protein (TIGR03067 family)